MDIREGLCVGRIGEPEVERVIVDAVPLRNHSGHVGFRHPDQADISLLSYEVEVGACSLIACFTATFDLERNHSGAPAEIGVRRLGRSDRDPSNHERLVIKSDPITDRNAERIGESALDDYATWSHPTSSGNQWPINCSWCGDAAFDQGVGIAPVEADGV